MSEQVATELAQCLLDYGQAIAHRAALEAAALLDRQSPYPPYDADVLLHRAAQALAAAVRAEVRTYVVEARERELRARRGLEGVALERSGAESM